MHQKQELSSPLAYWAHGHLDKDGKLDLLDAHCVDGYQKIKLVCSLRTVSTLIMAY